MATIRTDRIPTLDRSALADRIVSGIDLSICPDRDELLEGVEVLAAAIAVEQGLAPHGPDAVIRYVRGHLERLIAIRHDRVRYPEIATVAITQPLVIIGAPRGGTTFLHSLLAQDPGNRAPLGWECTFPSPPPETAMFGRDPRIERWNAQNSGTSAEAFHDVGDAEVVSKHVTGAHQPEECGYFLTSSMRGNDIWAMLRGAPYMHWMLNADMVPLMRIHREWLQHFQWRAPRDRWVLKNPPYCFYLDALTSEYPDARLVINHRDPVAVVSSLASLIESYRRTTYVSVDRHALGHEILHMVGFYLERPMTWRRENAEVPVLDIGYRALIADPLGVARQIYEFHGIGMSLAGEAAMQAYRDANPQGRHGAHRHALADYGLTEDIVRERFAPYVTAYGDLF